MWEIDSEWNQWISSKTKNLRRKLETSVHEDNLDRTLNQEKEWTLKEWARAEKESALLILYKSSRLVMKGCKKAFNKCLESFLFTNKINIQPKLTEINSILKNSTLKITKSKENLILQISLSILLKTFHHHRTLILIRKIRLNNCLIELLLDQVQNNKLPKCHSLAKMKINQQYLWNKCSLTRWAKIPLQIKLTSRKS